MQAGGDRQVIGLAAGSYAVFLLLGWKSALLPSLIRSIEHDFHQTDAGFAVLYLIIAVVYAGAAFAGGFLTERFGRRPVLVTGILLSGAGTAGQMVSPSWIAFLLASVPAAWGMGIIDGGINALFLDVFRFARGGTLNFLHLFFGLGALLGPLCVGLLLTVGTGWRPIVGGTAVVLLLSAIPFARFPMPSGRHGQHQRVNVSQDLSQSERTLIPFICLAVAIGVYVSAELGVSSWLVQLLSASSVAVATGVLSAFWAGFSLGRLLSLWLAEWLDYYAFTVGCVVLASVALAGALCSPWLPLTAILFAAAGMFYGPIFPMIMALGGEIYPHRLAALGGSLTAAAVIGGVVYPPLMGLLESRIGLSSGMLGAALLGIPMAAAVLLARTTARASSA